MTDPGRVWPVFFAVIAGYLAVTVAESVLAPLFPSVIEELGLDLGLAGFAFGLLTASIALGNLGGGVFLSRFGVKPGLIASLVLAGAGAWVASKAVDGSSFIAAQSLIGAGAGVFFVPGLDAIGRSATDGKRGLAMGLFGVAFSAGLAVAALLAALGAEVGWRTAFVVAAACCAVGVVVVLVSRLPGPAVMTSATRPARGVLTRPITVGAVGTVSQYGTIGFMALYAVTVWGMTPASAALVVAAGRVLSVPGKLVIGAAADRWGSGPALTSLAVALFLTGISWTTIDLLAVAVPAAVIYAAAVSGLFPIANLLAIEGFGGRGSMLGMYRSAQIAVGALGAWLIGTAAESVGLQATLVVTAGLPVVLAVKRRATA